MKSEEITRKIFTLADQTQEDSPLKSIILDTDPGVDDALAIILAINSPEIEIEAITTVAGNVNHSKAHNNAKKLLEFTGKTNIPVCSGAVKPLVGVNRHAERIHGKTGLGNAVLPKPDVKTHPVGAVEMILKKSKELGKDLTLVSIGPLTNIASAILADPELPIKVGGLVLMGGAFNLTPYGYGNANPVAEFNIWHDPEAAKIVFDSGVELTCAGLDVTNHPDNRMGEKMFEDIKNANTQRSRLIVNLCEDVMRRFNGFSLHDPMAIAYIISPSIFKTGRSLVEVELQGQITRGMTVVERRPFKRIKDETNAKIITEVNAEKFHKMIRDRVR